MMTIRNALVMFRFNAWVPTSAQGNVADVSTVAKMVLNDWLRGKIPYFVKPPGVSVVSGTRRVVSDVRECWVWVGC